MVLFYFCGRRGRFYGISVYVLTGARMARSIPLPLLSALLLVQIPLGFKLELGSYWKNHPLERYNILVALIGVFSSQGGLGEGTKLEFGEL